MEGSLRAAMEDTASKVGVRPRKVMEIPLETQLSSGQAYLTEERHDMIGFTVLFLSQIHPELRYGRMKNTNLALETDSWLF